MRVSMIVNHKPFDLMPLQVDHLYVEPISEVQSPLVKWNSTFKLAETQVVWEGLAVGWVLVCMKEDAEGFGTVSIKDMSVKQIVAAQVYLQIQQIISLACNQIH